jgi:hypothetical protein
MKSRRWCSSEYIGGLLKKKRHFLEVYDLKQVPLDVYDSDQSALEDLRCDKKFYEKPLKFVDVWSGEIESTFVPLVIGSILFMILLILLNFNLADFMRILSILIIIFWLVILSYSLVKYKIKRGDW